MTSPAEFFPIHSAGVAGVAISDRDGMLPVVANADGLLIPFGGSVTDRHRVLPVLGNREGFGQSNKQFAPYPNLPYRDAWYGLQRDALGNLILRKDPNASALTDSDDLVQVHGGALCFTGEEGSINEWQVVGDVVATFGPNDSSATVVVDEIIPKAQWGTNKVIFLPSGGAALQNVNNRWNYGDYNAYIDSVTNNLTINRRIAHSVGGVVYGHLVLAKGSALTAAYAYQTNPVMSGGTSVYDPYSFEMELRSNSDGSGTAIPVTALSRIAFLMTTLCAGVDNDAARQGKNRIGPIVELGSNGRLKMSFMKRQGDSSDYWASADTVHQVQVILTSDPNINAQFPILPTDIADPEGGSPNNGNVKQLFFDDELEGVDNAYRQLRNDSSLNALPSTATAQWYPSVWDEFNIAVSQRSAAIGDAVRVQAHVVDFALGVGDAPTLNRYSAVQSKWDSDVVISLADNATALAGSHLVSMQLGTGGEIVLDSSSNSSSGKATIGDQNEYTATGKLARVRPGRIHNACTVTDNLGNVSEPFAYTCPIPPDSEARFQKMPESRATIVAVQNNGVFADDTLLQKIWANTDPAEDTVINDYLLTVGGGDVNDRGIDQDPTLEQVIWAARWSVSEDAWGSAVRVPFRAPASSLTGQIVIDTTSDGAANPHSHPLTTIIGETLIRDTSGCVMPEFAGQSASFEYITQELNHPTSRRATVRVQHPLGQDEVGAALGFPNGESVAFLHGEQNVATLTYISAFASGAGEFGKRGVFLDGPGEPLGRGLAAGDAISVEWRNSDPDEAFADNPRLWRLLVSPGDAPEIEHEVVGWTHVLELTSAPQHAGRYFDSDNQNQACSDQMAGSGYVGSPAPIAGEYDNPLRASADGFPSINLGDKLFSSDLTLSYSMLIGGAAPQLPYSFNTVTGEFASIGGATIGSQNVSVTADDGENQTTINFTLVVTPELRVQQAESAQSWIAGQTPVISLASMFNLLEANAVIDVPKTLATLPPGSSIASNSLTVQTSGNSATSGTATIYAVDPFNAEVYSSFAWSVANQVGDNYIDTEQETETLVAAPSAMFGEIVTDADSETGSVSGRVAGALSAVLSENEEETETLVIGSAATHLIENQTINFVYAPENGSPTFQNV